MSNDTVSFIINRQECYADGTFDVVSPGTGKKTHQGGIATEADAIAAICMSTDRILIHNDVSSQFRQKFLATIEAMFPSEREGSILINKQAVEKNKRLLQDALDKGAVLLKGAIDSKETSSTGLRPSVVDQVKPDMDLYKIESFGPLVSLIDVDTEEEALRIANDIEYGLTSAVFTEDLRTGFRFAKGIESGACQINHMTIHDDTVLPHGGVKSSGYGRFNTMVGL